MAQFLLLLPHAPDRYTGLSKEAMMEVMKDYVAWVEKLTAEGVYAGGHKLVDQPGKILVAGAGGASLHDGPFAEMTEVLGGIMVINAEDYDEAVRIARTNPHLVHNKRIEIRMIQQV